MKSWRCCWVLAGTASIALAPTLEACGSDDDVSVASDSGSPEASGPIDATASAVDAGNADATPFDAGATCATCVTSIAVNGRNSCAIMGDTTVRCWGANNEGQLGSGSPDAQTIDFINVATPTPVTGLVGARSVTIGGFYDGVNDAFACATTADGRALCWGIDLSGELGRGDAGPGFADPSPAPILLSGPIVQLSASDRTACALDGSGHVACWGDNSLQEIVPTLGLPFTTPQPIVAGTVFTQISVGSDVCAIALDRHVWCWGHPLFGDLGRPTTDGGVQDYVPAQVTGLEHVLQIAVGGPGVCALTDDGIARCWGGSVYGTSLLGRGEVDSGAFDPTPAPVVMPDGVTFTQIVAHYNGFCALDTTGAVWCWGHNFNSAEGIATADGGELFPVWVPTQVPSLSKIAQLASGASALHVCALGYDGHVKCWGYNRYDQLGTAEVDGSALTSLVPLDVVF